MSTAAPTRTAADLFGVREVPAQGRDRLLVVAVDLFYRHGFNAVGLDRVITEAGVSKTTFYKHFESKDELMVAAVNRQHEWESAAWERAVRKLAGDDPRAQLRAFFEVIDIWFNDADFNGCLFTNAAAEFPNPHDPVHRAAAAHKSAMHRYFREQALAAGAADADAFTDVYTLLLEGALVLRQVHNRDDAARIALKAVDNLLAAHLGPARN